MNSFTEISIHLEKKKKKLKDTSTKRVVGGANLASFAETLAKIALLETNSTVVSLSPQVVAQMADLETRTNINNANINNISSQLGAAADNVHTHDGQYLTLAEAQATIAAVFTANGI